MGEYLTKENKNWEHLFLMKRTEDFSMANLFESYKSYVSASDFAQHYMEITEEDLYGIIITLASNNDKSVFIDEELTFDGSRRILSFTVFWCKFIIDLYKNSETGRCYISFIDTENSRYSTNIKYHHISSLRR